MKKNQKSKISWHCPFKAFKVDAHFLVSFWTFYRTYDIRNILNAWSFCNSTVVINHLPAQCYIYSSYCTHTCNTGVLLRCPKKIGFLLVHLLYGQGFSNFSPCLATFSTFQRMVRDFSPKISTSDDCFTDYGFSGKQVSVQWSTNTILEAMHLCSVSRREENVFFQERFCHFFVFF